MKYENLFKIKLKILSLSLMFKSKLPKKNQMSKSYKKMTSKYHSKNDRSIFSKSMGLRENMPI